MLINMKKFAFMVSMLLSLPAANAQGKWKITLNKRLILTASTANDSANTKMIRSSDWKSAGYLEVSYIESEPSGWRHAIHFADELGNDLLMKDSTKTAKIPLSSIRKLFAGKKTMKIYLTISPPNPMMMAPTRMVTLSILKLP
jgi:hypothetical protein